MRSFDASTRADLPVPFSAVAAVVAALRPQVESLVVVGAVARDLLACAAGGLPIPRVTKDVDIAIAVKTMTDYEGLTGLIKGRTPPRHHIEGLSVDVIPFGGVEAHGLVLFDNDFELDVTGFAEAARTAVDVTLPGGAVVPVASLPAQAALKLLAWRDRGNYHQSKDALDLRTLLKARGEGIYQADLYETEAFVRYDYALDKTAAYQLGVEGAVLLGGAGRAAVATELTSEPALERLADAAYSPVVDFSSMLHCYRDGFLDSCARG